MAPATRPLDYIVTERELEVLRIKLRLSKDRFVSETPSEEKTSDALLDPATTRRAIRIALATYALENAYSNIVLGLLRRKRFTHFFRDLTSRSSLRLAAFFSLYSTLYRVLFAYFRDAVPKFALRNLPRNRADSTTTRSDRPRGLSYYRPHLRISILRALLSPYVPPFLAGLLAGPTLLLDEPGQRRITLALYALTRSLQFGWLALCKRSWMPNALKQGRWWFGPHILFGLSNAQLLHAFTFDPDCFPEQFGNFIMRYSTAYVPQRPKSLPASARWPAPRQLVDAVAQLASSKPAYPKFESPLIHPGAPLPSKGALAHARPVLDLLAHPGHDKLVCAMLHPENPSCLSTYLHFVRHEFVQVSKFMAMLSLVGLVIRRKKFLKDPEMMLASAVGNTVSGSIAVSGAIGTAWALICASQAYLPSSFMPRRRFYLHGFLAGLWILAQPARATELGLYTSRLALQSAWQVGVKRRRFRSVPGGEAGYFALSVGVIMALWETQPDTISSGLVRNVLTRTIGPSRADLAKSA